MKPKSKNGILIDKMREAILMEALVKIANGKSPRKTSKQNTDSEDGTAPYNENNEVGPNIVTNLIMIDEILHKLQDIKAQQFNLITKQE